MEEKEKKINPNCSSYDYLLENNKKYMNLTALTWENRKISYEELHDRIEKYAKLLYKKGIRKNDVVGVCLVNTPESVYLLYALSAIGAQVVGFSLFDTKEKIKRDIELTRPKMIITVDMMYSNFKDYEKALDFSSILYSPLSSSENKKLRAMYKMMQLAKGNFKFSKNGNLEHLIKEDFLGDYEKSSYVPGELTDIMFTGGSTGIHKGVDLSANGLNYVVYGMNSIFEAEPGMIHLGNIPIGHMVFGRMIMHFSLCNNMQLALTLKAMPEDFYSELVRTQANAAVGGPIHWVSLIEEINGEFVPSSKLKTNTLQNLHYATSGGEAKKSTTDKAINDALRFCGSDAKLGDGLGATETWSTVIASNGRKNTPGTIGNAISTSKIKLINPETKEEVQKGEKGILYVSGPQVMLGYHNNPEETEKVLSYDEDGTKWCNLGDYLVELDNGEYKYVGRQKRNFVSGVDNIYPEQLETLLITLPEIREAVVTAISDEMRQYIPSYHISLYDINIDYELLEKKIEKLVISKLGVNWLPGNIEYFDTPLKRMANTKVDVTYYEARDKDLKKGKTLNLAK